MNTIKEYINEALFSRGGEDIVSKIDSSYKLDMPKTPKEYLNYMCAWNKVITELYELSYDNAGGLIKHTGEFMSYVFRLYFGNLPNFHLEAPSEWSISGDENKKVPIHKIRVYDAKMDDVIVKTGQIKISPKINKMIDDLAVATKEREIMKLKNDLTDAVYNSTGAKMMPGFVCTAEAWLIARRAEGISRLRVFDASSFLRNFNSKYLQENRNGMLGFLSKIKLAMGKSPYTKEATQLLQNVYGEWA